MLVTRVQVLDTTLEPVLLAVEMVQMLNWLEIKHRFKQAANFPSWKITPENKCVLGQQIVHKY